MAPPWGRSSDGRALQSHCRGQEFDPPRLHHFPTIRHLIWLDNLAPSAPMPRFWPLSYPTIHPTMDCLGRLPWPLATSVHDRTSGTAIGISCAACRAHSLPTTHATRSCCCLLYTSPSPR